MVVAKGVPYCNFLRFSPLPHLWPGSGRYRADRYKKLLAVHLGSWVIELLFFPYNNFSFFLIDQKVFTGYVDAFIHPLMDFKLSPYEGQ
jgi:hypothetical protein